VTDETIGGKPVSETQIQDWADEAEAGYDVATLRRRGRPALGTGDSTVVPVRLDAELLEALTTRARRENVSRSEAIRAAVRAWTHVA
jgi:hypothetical protein